MKRLRLLVVTLIAWLFFFYNIERLSEPIDITDVAYTFVPAMVAITVLAPRLRRVPLWAHVLVPIPVFLVLKVWMKSNVWGPYLPITVTEVCAIVLTTILARQVSIGISEFESAIAHITMGQLGKSPEPFSLGQGEIYRQVRRARDHQRPLALMAIRVEEESIKVALDRMVQEAQQALMKQYVMSSVSKTLCDELEDYNIIAKRNDHFLVLLPEVTPDKLPDLIKRLCKVVSEQVGVTLQVGTASLPENALTFEGLVEKAIEQMDAEPKPFPQSHQMTAKRLLYGTLQEKVDGLGDH
jgi:GGDEF domain-containing protein